MQRLSSLFGRTLREDPADATIASHRLMVRGAFIRPLGAGIFSYLPLGWRTLRRIEQVVREEMDAVGCQELLMPVVHPSTLWERTGRFASLGPELVRFKDRAERNMVLALTHEEIALDLAARLVGSYRQLPVSVYHFQTKFRDEPRPRGGLLRTREFTMKDAYTFDPSPESLDATYRQFVTAYVRAFRRCGIEPLVVESDAGAMGGSDADEFHALTSAGEDTIVVCPTCDYGANQEVATTRPPEPDDAEPLPMEKVETPGQETIAAVAGYLGIPTQRTLKAVFYWTGDQIAFVAIRGDLDVNEAKLRRALGAPDIRLAADQELTAAGLVPGYASPVGLEQVLVVVDRSVECAANLVAGANMPGVHLVNVNFPRDFAADIVEDIADVAAGDPCPKCGAALELRTGIEIGNTFKFGAYYSDKLDATVPIRGWVAAAHRDGLLRHWHHAAGGGRRGAAPRRRWDHLARQRGALRRARGAAGPGRRGDGRPPSAWPTILKLPAFRCWWTTVMRARGSSSTMPTSWGFPFGARSAAARCGPTPSRSSSGTRMRESRWRPRRRSPGSWRSTTRCWPR